MLSLIRGIHVDYVGNSNLGPNFGSDSKSLETKRQQPNIQETGLLR